MTGKRANGAPNYGVQDMAPPYHSDGRAGDYASLPEAESECARRNETHAAEASANPGCEWRGYWATIPVLPSWLD
jgi:hypothetical protein